MKNQSVTSNLDWITVLLYFILVVMGWLNIFSTSIPIEFIEFDFSDFYGKQLLFIILSIPIIIVVLTIDAKVYEKFSFVFYIIGIVSLLGLFVFGKTVKGQTNWYGFGSFGLQPSEFVKTATSLLIAKFLSDSQVFLKNTRHQLIAFGIILLPVFLILMQPDAGSAMIFLSLILVLNREGLPEWYLWTGFIAIVLFFMALLIQPIYILIGIIVIMIFHYLRARRVDRNPLAYLIVFVAATSFVLSVGFVFDNVLEPHQKDRINVLFSDDVDLKNEGYNLNQSMIAIGSGGLIGKGFMEGTQTKGGFVPEQHSDYIFTTVGEEWGFMGSTVVILLFVTLFLRIIYLAEQQKTKFSRVYGYCVASILFTHYFVNITMLIKLFPTIGVPLPFISYGGSSLWSFTILLFIFLKLDANKVNEW
ncbi:rod shape-determining protein RodA [Flavobacterium piscinae]|uniref:Rod shape-determining protein RodA n=1 Tax=Flavobacterium piscinae TaxID=2506424 RepID=A0A4Q1KYR8_9FLAO|nr:rod shape-determining protein RodA [Flavobacterium piscinae]RXR35541.1 rod shape-determining protein RodA [Flavobacterium piscinae]